MHKKRNLFDQDFRTELAWTIFSRHIESGPRLFQTLGAEGHWEIYPEKNLQK